MHHVRPRRNVDVVSITFSGHARKRETKSGLCRTHTSRVCARALRRDEIYTMAATRAAIILMPLRRALEILPLFC